MVNYLAILVSGIAAMVVGFLWYGPLFGKAWIILSRMDPKKIEEAKKKGIQGMWKSYLTMFLATLVTAYVTSYFVNTMNLTTVSQALQLTLWLWLGFFATTMIGTVLWENKPIKLYFLNIFHYLVSLGLMSVILTLWH